ncbi:MAG: hypothetical protein ACLR0N_19435 [Bilophila wadsworthia]
MTTPTQLFTLLDACFDAQNEATALWHSQEPEADVAPTPLPPRDAPCAVPRSTCGISGSGTLRTRPAAAT